MTDREKVIAAYECSNEKLPDKRCEKCPFGYEYLDQTGDTYFVGCNTERMMVDAIDLLKAQEPVEPKKNDVELAGLRTWDWACPECNCILIYRANYCSCCGRAVKWE